MAEVKLLAPFILKWEGGFVNDPLDRGGATNKGVTIATYEAYCKKKGRPKPTIENLKTLSEKDWTEIMKSLYWDKWRADEIQNQSIANILVDWVWASGAWGIKIPQRILGLAQDGIVGINTLNAINSYRPASELFKRIRQARLDFVDDICKQRPANEKFRKGWNNRINAFVFSE